MLQSKRNTNGGSFDVIVYKGLSIVSDADLYFGIVAPSATNQGKITIARNGSFDMSAANGVSSVSGSGTAGQFTVTGTKNITYSLTLPTSNINLTKSGAKTPMPLALSLDFVNRDIGSQFDSNGEEIVYVIGELTVNPNQANGNYTDTYNIDANY